MLLKKLGLFLLAGIFSSEIFFAVPPRILHVLNDLDLAGVQTLRLGLIGYLRSKEFINSCLTIGRGPLFERFNGLCPTYVVNLPAVPQGQTEAVMWMAFCSELRRIILINKIDIVHCGHWQAAKWAQVACAGLGVPVIEDFHFLANYPGEAGRIFLEGRIEYNFQSRVTKLCASHGIADSFKMKDGQDQCVVIPNAVDPEAFAFRAHWREEIRARHGLDPNCYVIGSVGRLAQEKDFGRLINLFGDFVNRRGDRTSQLLIVGDGPLREQLEALVVQRGLVGRVTLAPFVKDVAKYYSALDLYVCSSNSEGFSLALLEALAAGLPCLSSLPFQGLEEILEELTLEAMERVFRQSPDRASKLPEYFHINRMLADYEALYMRLMEEAS